MGSGSVKGTVLLSRLSFLRERIGKERLARVLARLDEADRKRMAGILLPSSWYPFALADQLDRAIVDELALGEGGHRALGAWSAESNLGDAHRNFVDARDPHGLLKQAASIYRLYYDSGRRTYERADDHKAIIRTFAARSFSHTDCLSIAGWHEKAIALCGGRDARVTETHCRANGDDHCEYVCEWR